MKGLYKGKYIIAVYDKNDYLIDVACLPSQLNCFENKEVAMAHISHIAAGRRTSNYIHLIDVTEKHDDIFAEEDQLFLEYVKKTTKKTDKEKASEFRISRRTYCRKKCLYKGLERDNFVTQ